jgi:hypothetical protein
MRLVAFICGEPFFFDYQVQISSPRWRRKLIADVTGLTRAPCDLWDCASHATIKSSNVGLSPRMLGTRLTDVGVGPHFDYASHVRLICKQNNESQLCTIPRPISTAESKEAYCEHSLVYHWYR